jgi:hypothetical protein
MTTSLRTAARRTSWLSMLLLGGCNSRLELSESSVSAQFGLFFGGQIQQRLEIPFELDSTRQTQGFRLVFERPMPKPTIVQWSLDYPTARTGPRGPSNAPRAERTERATLPQGAEQFEQMLALRPTDPFGTYNIRVRLDDEIVLDRPFRLSPKQLDSEN